MYDLNVTLLCTCQKVTATHLNRSTNRIIEGRVTHQGIVLGIAGTLRNEKLEKNIDIFSDYNLISIILSKRVCYLE